MLLDNVQLDNVDILLAGATGLALAEPHRRSALSVLCLQVLCSDGQGKRKVSETLTVVFWSTDSQVQANENPLFDLAML